MRRDALLWVVVLGLFAVTVSAQPPAQGTVKGKPALLVMDVQNLYLGMMDQFQPGLRVVGHQRDHRPLPREGLPGHQGLPHRPRARPGPGHRAVRVPGEIRVTPDDPIVVKNHAQRLRRDRAGEDSPRQRLRHGLRHRLSAVGCALATYFDADGRDFRAFMVKSSLLSHRADLTRAVEDMTDAVPYDAVKYMLLNAPSGT